MTKSSLSDMLSKLSLNTENEDKLSFYLSFLRRKGKNLILFSKKACFVKDIESNKWIYLELKRNSGEFAWGCSSCENLKTFRNMQALDEIVKGYFIHAQVACMMINEMDLEKKFDEPEEVFEVIIIRLPQQVNPWKMKKENQTHLTLEFAFPLVNL